MKSTTKAVTALRKLMVSGAIPPNRVERWAAILEKAEHLAVQRSKRGRPRKVDRGQVRRLAAEGLSVAEIAQQCQCSRRAVYLILKGCRHGSR